VAGASLIYLYDTRVRSRALTIVRWTYLLAMLLSITAMFLPCVVVTGTRMQRTSVSLYRAQADRELAARFVASYQHAHGKRVGGAIVGRLTASTTGRAHDAFDDAQSAMETLDGLGEDDARTYGRIAAIAVWLDLVALAGAFALVLGDAITGVARRGRMVAAALVAVVCLGFAVVAHLVCAEVVFEANDEVGAGVLELGWGAYALPVANAVAVVAIVAAIAVATLVRRCGA
jgi:hypothetical protein